MDFSLGVSASIDYELVWTLFYAVYVSMVAILMSMTMERRYSRSGTVLGWVAITVVPVLPVLYMVLSGDVYGLDTGIPGLDSGPLIGLHTLAMPLTVVVASFLYKGDVKNRVTVALLDYIVITVGACMTATGVVKGINTFFAGNTHADLLMCELAFGAITIILMGNRMVDELRGFMKGRGDHSAPYMVVMVFMSVCTTVSLLLWLYDTDETLLSSSICAITAISFIVMIRMMFLSIEDISSSARRDAELDTARDLQRSIIPDGGRIRWMLGAEIGSVMEPAREVAGDFCDFFPIDDRRLGIVIADVSDKGIPAALFMMRCKSIIKDRMMSGDDLGTAVTSANRSLCDDNPSCMFVTAFMGVLDMDTGVLEYVDAGHVPPFVRMSGDIVRLTDGKGPMMGLMELEYTPSHVTLSDGDMFLAYTDGVNESERDGGFYGEGRIPEIMAGCTTAGGLVDALRSDVRSFMDGSEPTDDMTILSMSFFRTVSRVFTAEASSCQDIVSWVSGNCPVGIAMKAELVTEEMVLNIANHAYGGRGGEARIIIRPSEEHAEITFIDSGPYFDPTVDRVRPETPLEEREPGGEGLHLVRSMVGSMEYRRTGERNIVTISI